ncbi:MAG: hypothetical protein AB7F99_10170 [Vicinamibacterales bacterium]
MVLDNAAFLDAYEDFFDKHTSCVDRPDRLQIGVWIPRSGDECTVRLSCGCGASVFLEGTRIVAQAVVAACRTNGVPVVEHPVEPSPPESRH